MDIEQARNAQNDRNWSEGPLPLQDRIVPRQQHPQQVMCWAGVGYGVKTPLFFVPAGTSINGEVYREFLRTKVFPWARRTYGNRPWVFMQDPAPSHKAIETQDLIRANVSEFIEVDISPQRKNGKWPATSPDLNPLDYSIWNELKTRACAKKHQTVEALKRSLLKAWDEIPQEMINRAVDDFSKRLRKCIQANGGYFEDK
uniref:Tc1-like transposase DDE domain-containing protein n=1 Tax=Acrobeloides nanus TaxID=290746 RepID=A0A914C723_9BILA